MAKRAKRKVRALIEGSITVEKKMWLTSRKCREVKNDQRNLNNSIESWDSRLC
jgi:hypothetical protein